jgi:hypothetical protein
MLRNRATLNGRPYMSIVGPAAIRSRRNPLPPPYVIPFLITPRNASTK